MPLTYSTNLGPLDRLKNNAALGLRRRVFELFMRECAPGPDALVADFGASGHRDHSAHFFFEMLYPHRERLTVIARAEEDAGWFPEKFPGLHFLEADLRSIPRPDGYFEAGICNAVLEHAGPVEQQAAVVREVCRVCRRVLFTTPNRDFPLELHTFLPFVHWLPDPAFRAVLRRLGHTDFACVDNLNLLDSHALTRLLPAGRRNRVIALGPSFLSTNLVALSFATDGDAPDTKSA